MGRGDVKTAKGKRFKGSFGVSRPKNKPKTTEGVVKVPKVKAVKSEATESVKKAPAKKTAAKKTAKKDSE